MYNMFERIIVDTICYRTFDGEGHLFRICYKPLEKIKAEVEEVNKNKPEKFMDEKIDWNNIKEFYVSQQEEF